MRKRNATPFLFAATTTSRKPPTPEVSIAVRGRFVLAPGVLTPLEDQGRMSGDLFEEDDADCVGGSSKPSDLAAYKLRGEILLTGLCHAPGGKPVGESFVRLVLKTVTDKPLCTIDRRVFGPRVWNENLVGKPYTDPLPFTTMPLGWAHSFGGENFPDNPVGKGIGGHELPNVEWPSPITKKGERPKPACPGPISPLWAARRTKQGKEYGKDYAKERAPYFASDFDWAYFQSAPPEQQLEGYLRGDERLELVNLHPTTPNVGAELPGLRVRVFLSDVHGKFREVPMVLDTLHVDSREGFVDLTWRGLGPAAEQDLSDLHFAIIASEPLAEQPKPLAHYEAQMGDFVADPLGLRDAIPAAVRPHYDRAQKLAEEQRQPKAEGGAAVDPLDAEIDRAASMLEPEQAAELKRAVAEMREIATRMHAEAVSQAREAGKPAPPPLDETIARAVAEAKAPKPSPVDFAPDGKPRIALAGAVSAQKQMLENLRTQSELPPEAKAKIVEAEAKLEDDRLGELDPSLRGEAPLVEPGPGADLRKRDLRGHDLSGRDLSGSDLRGTLLSGAKLRGANLSGCVFAQALLDHADLQGADLSDAKLDQGIFLEADFTGAKLDRSTLDQAVFVRAKFDGASLEAAKGMLVLLSKASFRGAKAHRLELLQSELSECDLEEADFTDASLVRCLIREAKGRGAIFESARLGHVSFESADLATARFAHATGPFPCFIQAKLDQTDFSHVVFPGAHFSESRGASTRFYAANLPDARFYRAKLERAVFDRANLKSCDFGLALIPRSSFEGASLYDAKMIRTAGEGCNFVNANLTRSTLESA